MIDGLTIALAQLNPVVGDLKGNADKVVTAWHETNADLIVFPELVTCGYPPEDLILKPSFIDDIKRSVEDILARSRDFTAGAILPSPWKIDDQIYNAALVIESGKIIATVLKNNLPNSGIFDELRIFKAGPLPSPVEFRGREIGLMICEDMWYADVAKHLKDHGADILIVPNASPYQFDKLGQRLEHARARVKETGLPLVYVNQVGGQDELVFDGGSFVLQADGALHTHMPLFVESLQTTDNADITPALDQPAAIYQALMLGLQDYISKNNFPGVLIGLSGGVDSALTATIAVDALGADKVQCVMMPSKFTSRESLDDAARLAQNLSVQLENISIEGAVDTLNQILANHAVPAQAAISDTAERSLPAQGQHEGIAYENIQSRARGLILMALSNARGHMVLSTGNKSEMAVGYATLYGDMCGGYNVLKDVYKTQVYDLCAWRNDHIPQGGLDIVGELIPGNILTKAPTAELKDNQTDQDSLPAYDVLDDILHGLIEEELGLDEIVKRGHDRETALKVWRLLDRSEYKRRQAPPGAKITSRAFGRDRRYPITNHYLKQK